MKTTTKFLVSYIFKGSPVQRIEVLRETPRFVIELLGDGSTRKKMKDTGIRQIFNNEDEAWKEAERRDVQAVKFAETALDTAKKALERTRSRLTQPTARDEQ